MYLFNKENTYFFQLDYKNNNIKPIHNLCNQLLYADDYLNDMDYWNNGEVSWDIGEDKKQFVIKPSLLSEESIEEYLNNEDLWNNGEVSWDVVKNKKYISSEIKQNSSKILKDSYSITTHISNNSEIGKNAVISGFKKVIYKDLINYDYITSNIQNFDYHSINSVFNILVYGLTFVGYNKYYDKNSVIITNKNLNQYIKIRKLAMQLLIVLMIILFKNIKNVE